MDIIKTQTFKRAGMLYWFEEPNGFRRENGLPPGVKIHGPFKTQFEVNESQRLVLLGPDCQVTEGGRWDKAWDELQ